MPQFTVVNKCMLDSKFATCLVHTLNTENLWLLGTECFYQPSASFSSSPNLYVEALTPQKWSLWEIIRCRWIHQGRLYYRIHVPRRRGREMRAPFPPTIWEIQGLPVSQEVGSQQALELWEINVCCLKCFICVSDAFVKAFRIEEDTGWEIAFRKGVKLCLEKRQLQTHQAVWHVSSAGPRSGLCLVPQAQAFSPVVVLLHTMYGKDGIYWHDAREIRPGLME